MATPHLSLDYLSGIGFSVARAVASTAAAPANVARVEKSSAPPQADKKSDKKAEDSKKSSSAPAPAASAAAPVPAAIAVAALGGDVACTLRVLTFNVLFPNSETSGVWWIFKYYDANLDAEAKTGKIEVSDWSHRKVLLSKLITSIDADLVCFQEPWNCRGVPKVAPVDAAGKPIEGEGLVQLAFNADFAFMGDLGYEGELLGKGNIRPATFWKSKVNGAERPLLNKVSTWHKVSRALVQLFEVTAPSSPAAQLVAVANCHLTAGPFPKQRLGTIEDAIKAAGKLRDEKAKEAAAAAPKAGKKGKGVAAPAGPPFAVVICGDFNSEGEQVDTFLRTGEAGPDSVLDKVKKHALPKFVDCGERSGPTLIVPNVDTKMLRAPEDQAALPAELAARCEELSKCLESSTGRCDENGALPSWPTLDQEVLRTLNERALTAEMLQALSEAFETVRSAPSASPPAAGEISGEQVSWWINRTNKAERGTEFRRARGMQLAKVSASGGSPDGPLPGLTFNEFASVFRLECEEGKFWSLEHDLQALRNGRSMRIASEPAYQGRFDRIYISSVPEENGLKFLRSDVLACFPAEVGVARRGDGALRSLQELGLASAPIDSFTLPNGWHPSDHLPVLAEFALPCVSAPAA